MLFTRKIPSRLPSDLVQSGSSTQKLSCCVTSPPESGTARRMAGSSHAWVAEGEGSVAGALPGGEA